MKTLATFTPRLEVYSIDEAFLDLTACPMMFWLTARHIRETGGAGPVFLSLLGLGRPRRLAKIANKLGKERPGPGRGTGLGTYPDPDAILEQVAVGDSGA